MSDDKKKTPDGRPKGGASKKPANPAKTRTSNHHPDEEPAFNTVLESAEPKKSEAKGKPSKPVKGISRPSALFLSLLAALAGGAIGWGGPTLFGGQGKKTDALQASLEQTRTDLAAAKIEQDKLADALAAIQGTSRSQATSNQSLMETITALEDQVKKLQEADPSNALTEIEERISTLSSLSVAENEDGTASVDLLGLMDRIDALESGLSGDLFTRVEALESQVQTLDEKPIAFPEPDSTPIELPPVETEQSAQEALNVLIDTFPRTKMLETVEAQNALAAKKPSWLQRTLSRHIKTHDEEKTDPVDTINSAEAALKRGEVTTALEHLGDLNPPVRAVAAEWMGAAKKAAKQIEKDL